MVFASPLYVYSIAHIQSAVNTFFKKIFLFFFQKPIDNSFMPCYNKHVKTKEVKTMKYYDIENNADEYEEMMNLLKELAEEEQKEQSKG